MEEYINIKTKQFRGSGFMTISKYNNNGDIIYISDKDSKLIYAVDAYEYNIIGTFSGHNGIIWNLDISKDDSILITASGDTTIRFFNTITGEQIFRSNEKDIPKYVCTQKKEQITNLVGIICEALTRKSTTYISIYDLDNIHSNIFSEKCKLMWNKQSKPTVILWLNDNELIIGCDDGKIIIRSINDIEGLNDIEYQIHSNSIKSIVWNRFYTQILTSSLDCTAKDINVKTWDIISTYKSTVPINYACWNYNNKKVYLGGGIEAMNVAKTSDNDLNLKIYKTSDQKLTQHIGSHFGPIRYIDIAPYSTGFKNFVTASQDGSVKIYIDDDNTKINYNLNKKNHIKFGLAEKNDIKLTDETTKIINLNWKPPKIIEQQKIQSKWIPGMPKLENNNNGIYEINNVHINKELSNENNPTILITNLPNYIKHKDLYELFDLYGRIDEKGGINIKNYKDSTMAFIRYIYHDSAMKAIENMDGYNIDHYIIKVEQAKSKY